jgi:hypothetical protein
MLQLKYAQITFEVSKPLLISEDVKLPSHLQVTEDAGMSGVHA